MIFFILRTTALLMSSLAWLSYANANTQTVNYLELLGKPISAVKDIYSCAPTMISGPSKKKLICANSDEKLIASLLKNRIVSITIFQFTNRTSIADISLSFPQSCQLGSQSKMEFKFNCESEKKIFLDLDVEKSELISEFCFLNFCNSNFD